MYRKNLDLIVATFIAMLNVLWAFLPNHLPTIGIILALPLVFILPGYTLVAMLFHKVSLGLSYKITLSLALSLAIDIIGGFILNLFPIGLRAVFWAVLLSLLTIAFSLIAAFLRRGLLVHAVQPGRLRFAFYEYLLFGLAIIIASLSLLYAIRGAVQQTHPGFTQLWILPPSQADKGCVVHLGMHSFELTPVTYRITMTVMGNPVTSWSSITLAPQQEWDDTVKIISNTTKNIYVELRLYRLDKPKIIYRNVHITLPSCVP